MGVQQRGADALALAVRADREDGQVVMVGTGRVVAVQLLIEGQEVTQVRAGEGGQLPGVAVGWWTRAAAGGSTARRRPGRGSSGRARR